MHARNDALRLFYDCGAKDTVTDTGSKIPHKYTTYNSNNDATCTDAAGNYQYCFCGAVIDFVQTGADALGHLYNDLRDQSYPNNNYYANATCVYYCSQCEKDVTEKNVADTNLFTAFGYSANEQDSTNVAFIVYANSDAIVAYSALKGIDIAYGLVVSATPDGTPLSFVNDELTEDANTVKINMTGTNYNKLTVRVSKLPVDQALHCNGYVVVGTDIYYLNHATVDTEAQNITHAGMIDLLEENDSTEGEETPEVDPAH